jgi:assimilatory nitrate reductase catalytic subunit
MSASLVPASLHPVTLRTPLWPAGHLPLKGRDQPLPCISRIATDAGRAEWLKLQISPLEGEMAGRPEGGLQP